MKVYRLLSDSAIDKKAVAGTLVYECMKCDYGLSNDDTRFTGVYHTSVTLNENGDYPFFTVPVSCLEVVK
jgi:hypothetical protein